MIKQAKICSVIKMNEAGVMPLLFSRTGKRVAQALEVIYEDSFVYCTFKGHLALHGNVQ